MVLHKGAAMTTRCLILPAMIMTFFVSFAEKEKRRGTYQITPMQIYQIARQVDKEFSALHPDFHYDNMFQLVLGTIAASKGLGFIKYCADIRDRALVENLGYQQLQFTTMEDLKWSCALSIVCTYIYYKHKAIKFKPESDPAIRWKRYYNTIAGKGRPEHYRNKYALYVTPLLKEIQNENSDRQFLQRNSKQYARKPDPRHRQIIMSPSQEKG